MSEWLKRLGGPKEVARAVWAFALPLLVLSSAHVLPPLWERWRVEQISEAPGPLDATKVRARILRTDPPLDREDWSLGDPEGGETCAFLHHSATWFACWLSDGRVTHVSASTDEGKFEPSRQEILDAMLWSLAPRASTEEQARVKALLAQPTGTVAKAQGVSFSLTTWKTGLHWVNANPADAELASAGP